MYRLIWSLKSGHKRSPFSPVPVDRAHEGDHGEDRGDAQPHPGGGGAPVQVEADPGHHHYQAAGDVDLKWDFNITLSCSLSEKWSLVCIRFPGVKINSFVNILL